MDKLIGSPYADEVAAVLNAFGISTEREGYYNIRCWYPHLTVLQNVRDAVEAAIESGRREERKSYQEQSA